MSSRPFFVVLSLACGAIASPWKPLASRNESASPCAIVSASASAALVASPSGTSLNQSDEEDLDPLIEEL